MLSAQSAVVQPQDVINNDAGHRGIDIKSRGRWGTLKRLFLFCKPQHIRIFAGLSSLTLNSITNLYFPWMMGQVLDNASATSAIDNMWRFLYRSLGVIAVGSLSSWVRVYCLQTSGRMISGAMKEQLFGSYIEKDIHYFDEAGIGEMITVMEQDVEKASGAITEHLPAGVRSFNSAVNGSLLLFMTSPQLCAVALSLTPVFGVMGMFIRRSAKRLGNMLRELQSDAMNFVTEKFSNVSTIRLNCREKDEISRFTEYCDSCYAVSASSHASEGAFMGFLNMSTNVSLLLILFAGGRMISKGQLTAGSLTRFAMQSAFVGLGFSGLAGFYGDLCSSLDAAARVFDVIDKNRADREVSLDAADKEFNVGTECDSLIGDRGIGIQTNDLSFSYPSRPSENVLKGISITVKPRQLVAFVGKSGSGKSTLLSIIAGLYLCKDGEVTMGGYDLSRSHSLVLNQVGVVEQKSGLFSGTILDNICYGKLGATLEQAKLAAKDANADEFIEHLPEGYNTQIGWCGSRLSGGQQARLALARALVKDPSVLLLDEPSAALDAESEKYLVDALLRLKKTKTIVVCTHSESLMTLADSVFVIRGGEIVVSGAYAEIKDCLNAHASEEET